MQGPVYTELQSYGHLVNECISFNDNKDPTQGYYPYRTDLARFSNQYGDIRNVLFRPDRATCPSSLCDPGAGRLCRCSKAMFQVIGEKGRIAEAGDCGRSRSIPVRK